MKPTRAQAQAEADEIESLKHGVPEYSRSGDDNHAVMGAMIAVLREGMDDEDKVFDRFVVEDSESDGVLDAALDACLWLRGDSDYGSLADRWRILADR